MIGNLFYELKIFSLFFGHRHCGGQSTRPFFDTDIEEFYCESISLICLENKSERHQIVSQMFHLAQLKIYMRGHIRDWKAKTL